MKKVIDSVSIRCISHATEELDKVMKALEYISGHRDFTVNKTKGYHGNEIIVLQLTLKNSKLIENFWRRMLELGVVDEIMHELENIIDNNGNLYLRLDKQEAYLERIAFTSSGDAIVIHSKILSYPKRKCQAIKNFKEFVEKIQCSLQ